MDKSDEQKEQSIPSSTSNASAINNNLPEDNSQPDKTEVIVHALIKLSEFPSVQYNSQLITHSSHRYGGHVSITPA